MMAKEDYAIVPIGEYMEMYLELQEARKELAELNILMEKENKEADFLYEQIQQLKLELEECRGE